MKIDLELPTPAWPPETFDADVPLLKPHVLLVSMLNHLHILYHPTVMMRSQYTLGTIHIYQEYQQGGHRELNKPLGEHVSMLPQAAQLKN